MTRRKSEDDIDPRIFTDLGIVTRIDDSDVNEVSNVDDPATDIDFALFKSIEKAPGLADLEACLRENVGVPGECESREEGYGDLLRADVRSHEDSGSPPERTEAIKGDTMSRKIEALAGAPADPMAPLDAPAPAGDVIEIPATPVEFSLPQCIQAGLDLQLNEDQAGQVCLVIRDQYGAPGEDGTILLPEGVKPDAIIAATAEALGFAQLAGKKAPEVPKSYRGVGSHWEGVVNKLLGRKSSGPRPGEELARVIHTLRKKVEDAVAENQKTREDLRLAMRLQDRTNQRQAALLAAALNVKLPDEEDFDAESGATPPAAAAPAATPNPLVQAGEGKRVKCGKCGHETPAPVAAAPATPAVPAAAPAKAETTTVPTDAERIDRIEQLLEQVLMGQGAAVPPIDEGGDELEQEEDEAILEETLEAAGAGVPGKRASTPLASAMAARMVGQKSAMRAALGSRNGGMPKGYTRSTITGMVNADADVAALSAGRNVRGFHVKR